MPRPHQGQLLPRTCQEEPEDTDGQRAAAGRTANLRSAFGPDSRSPLLEIPGLGPRNFQNPEALSFRSTSREGMPVTTVLRDGPAGTHGDLRAPPKSQALRGAPGSFRDGSGNPSLPGSCVWLARWPWAGETPWPGDSRPETFPGHPTSSGLQLQTKID